MLLGLAAAPSTVSAAQVTQVTLSPASLVGPGTTVAVVVAATAPCGAIEINFGDGTDQTFPVSTLPLSKTHAYAAAGTFTVTAKGQGNCTGQVTTTLQVAVGHVTGVTTSPASPVAPGTTVAVVVAATARVRRHRNQLRRRHLTAPSRSRPCP